MPVEIKVPSVGESINEVVISNWFKSEGEAVEMDEAVVELESDKATVEVPAPATGVISKVLKKAGDSAEVGEVIAMVEEGAAATAAPKSAAAPKSSGNGSGPAVADNQPADGSHTRVEPQEQVNKGTVPVMPSAQRLAAERGIDPASLAGSGPGGRVLKEDVLRAEKGATQPSRGAAPAAGGAGTPAREKSADKSVRPTNLGPYDVSELEDIVPMSPIRRRIAERLVESQQTAALLTTFNEIDMSAVMGLRKQHQESFQQRYGIKLGFMSFFVKAAVDALKQFPAVNAEIRGTNIVYKNYYDIGIAIGGGKGLVVPVVRGADRLSFAEVELVIEDFARRAQDNKLDIEELQGGTFTISNGGVYGSLMATPIVNPPQVAILGIHAIQERPVVRDGQIVARPMMYVALSYDHRIVDGRESVTFLKRIKEAVENPARMLLEV